MTAPSGVITRIWRVDQGVAERFLATEKQPERGVSGTNRKFSPDVVNDYAFEMLDDHWGFSHEGFAFIGYLDRNTAEMKDGGQRCRALVQACTKGATKGGVTLPPNPDFAFDVMVTEGLDEDSWRIMNIGKRRTVGDFMTMEGEVNSNVLTAIIQMCHTYETVPPGVPFLREHWTKGSMSPLARKEYLDAHPGIREAMYEGSRLGRVMTSSAAASGYFLARSAGIPKEVVDEFMDALREGVGEDWGEDNPIHRLREMFLNARTKRRKLPREEQLALFIKTLKAFHAGQKIRNLSFRTKKASNGTSAETFPRFDG